ncbi:MAG: MFS transporter [Promethearchaeota archaeon]
MEDVVDASLSKKKLPPKVYAVGAMTQFAVGLYQPFLQVYVIDMGATLGQLGLFRSVGSAAPNALQPAWGALCDRIRRAKAFVVFGTFTGMIMVLMFLWAGSPSEMIVLYAIQSILFSMQIPTWQSLLGGLMEEENRGTELGRLGVAVNVAALCATLLSGFIAGFPFLISLIRGFFGDLGLILFPAVESWREAYYIPFYLTAIVGILASIAALTIQEGEREKEGEARFPNLLNIATQPGDFRRLWVISILFSFSMSIAWPYFMVVQREWLGNTNLEVAIASVVMTATTVIFTMPMGQLSDRIGRKPLIVIGRSLLFLVPILYAFASNVYIIYIANALAGFSVASSFNSITAYIYDVAPEEERSSHLAVFNTLAGIVYFCGSLFSGIVGDWISIGTSRYFAVFTMLLLSGVMRLFSSSLYVFLREPREYSSNMRMEIRSWILRRRFDRDID